MAANNKNKHKLLLSYEKRENKIFIHILGNKVIMVLAYS